MTTITSNQISNHNNLQITSLEHENATKNGVSYKKLAVVGLCVVGAIGIAALSRLAYQQVSNRNEQGKTDFKWTLPEDALINAPISNSERMPSCTVPVLTVGSAKFDDKTLTSRNENCFEIGRYKDELNEFISKVQSECFTPPSEGQPITLKACEIVYESNLSPNEEYRLIFSEGAVIKSPGNTLLKNVSDRLKKLYTDVTRSAMLSKNLKGFDIHLECFSQSNGCLMAYHAVFLKP